MQDTKPNQSLPANNSNSKFSQGKLIKTLKTASFILGVILAAWLLNLFVFQSYYVEGTSMQPTLQNNDRLVINKLPLTWAKIKNQAYQPKRGDIVVISSQDIPSVEKAAAQIVKRVIGLSGERVIVQDGQVTIFNKAHPAGFNPDKELGLNLAPTFSEFTINVVVPKDRVFVLGDNRAPGGSYDSREFGPVLVKDVLGPLKLRIWPINHLRLF